MTLFGDDYQGKAFFEVFNPRGRDPLELWKVKRVGRYPVVEFDRHGRSNVVKLDRGAELRLPNGKEHRSMGLYQPFLVLQVRLGDPPATFALHLEVTDQGGARRRMAFSTSFSKVKREIHAQIPLPTVPRGTWVNLCLHLGSLVPGCFPGQEFKSVDTLALQAQCVLRKVFTMACPPVDTVDEVNRHGAMVIDANLDFPAGVDAATIILDADLVLGGADAAACEGDSLRGADGMASATSQRHRSAGTLGRGQVLAFGSRTAAAKSPQKASRGVGRRGTLGANDVDDSGLAALQAEGEGAEALAGRSGSGTRGQRRGAGGQSAHGGNGQALAAGRLPRMLEPVTPQRPQQATSSRRLSVGPEDAPLRDAVSKLHQRKPQLRPIDMKAVKDVGMDRVQVLSDRPPLPDHSTTPPTGFLTERANRDSRGNGSFGAATPHAWGSASAASSGQQRWSGSHGSWAISPTADEAAAAMWEGVPRPQPGNEEPALPTVRPSPATVAHGAHYQFSAGPRAGPFAQLQVHATDLSLDSGIGESPMDKRGAGVDVGDDEDEGSYDMEGGGVGGSRRAEGGAGLAPSAGDAARGAERWVGDGGQRVAARKGGQTATPGRVRAGGRTPPKAARTRSRTKSDASLIDVRSSRAGFPAHRERHASEIQTDAALARAGVPMPGESVTPRINHAHAQQAWTSGRAGPAQESVACEVDESANLAASNAGPMYHLWGSQALGGAAPDASAQAEPSPDRDARRLAPGPLPPLAPGDPRDTPARAAAASPGVEHPGSKQSRSRRRIATDVNRAAELSRMQGWDKSLEDAGRAALTAAGGLGIVGVGVDPLSGAGAGLPGGSGAGPRVSGPRHSGPRSPGAAMYGRGHRRSQSGSFSLHSDGARRPRRATTPVGLDPDSPDQSGRYLPQAWQTGAPGGDGGGGGGGDGHAAAAPPNPFPAIRESSLSPVPSPSYVSRQQRYQRVQESVAAANLAAGLPTVLESGSRASQGTASEGPSKVVSATSAGAWPPPAGSGSAHANASSSGDVVVVDASGSRTSGGVQRSPLGLDASAQLSGSTDAPAPPAAADVSPELPRASRGVEAAQAAPPPDPHAAPPAAAAASAGLGDGATPPPPAPAKVEEPTLVLPQGQKLELQRSGSPSHSAHLQGRLALDLLGQLSESGHGSLAGGAPWALDRLSGSEVSDAGFEAAGHVPSGRDIYTPPIIPGRRRDAREPPRTRPAVETDGRGDSEGGGAVQGEAQELELIYDAVLNCYLDPRTDQYYMLRI